MKKTNKEMYLLIKELLGDNAEVVEFCDKMLAQLNKKSKSTYDEELAEKVFATIEDYGQPISNEELCKTFGLTFPKVGALIGKMVANGFPVAKKEIKGKVHYTIEEATEELA